MNIKNFKINSLKLPISNILIYNFYFYIFVYKILFIILNI